MNCEFSREHFLEILTEINHNGYYCASFESDSSEQYQILIRHDIDVSIEAALDMAEMENSKGIKATYFVWCESPFYNFLAAEKVVKLKKILQLGHKIGLHFEMNYFNGKNTLEKIKFQRNILEQTLDYKISVISFHRPNKFIMRMNIPQMDGMINAYSAEYLKNFTYISDSRKEWKNQCICSLIKNNFYKKIYVLIHPIWWNNNLNSMNKFIDFAIKENSTSWREHINSAMN